MSRRVINVLGKQYPLGSYVKAVKLAKCHPNQKFKHGLCSWWPTTGQEIYRDFIRGLHDRINIRGNVRWGDRPSWFYRKKYFNRMGLTCKSCGVILSFDRQDFNPNIEHHFCSTQCHRDYFG